MKRIKTFKLFEGLDIDKSVVNDILLDFTDEEISTDIGLFTFQFLDIDLKYTKNPNKGKECFTIRIGDYDKPFSISNKGDCLYSLIDYMKNSGLVLNSLSNISLPTGQKYEGCPRCLSSDFEDIISGYERGRSICNNCGFTNSPDAFIGADWPLNMDLLERCIKNGIPVDNIALYFSENYKIY